jgi:hypothetical protein
MSLKDKNLFFYSTDINSKKFLEELSKNSILKSNFVCINSNDPYIKIPHKIKTIGLLPVLIVGGFNKPIVGEDILIWMKSNIMVSENNTSSGVPMFASFNDNTHKFSTIENSNSPSSIVPLIGSSYSPLTSENRIVTFDEPSTCRKDIGEVMEKRMHALKSQRDNDITRPIARI